MTTHLRDTFCFYVKYRVFPISKTLQRFNDDFETAENAKQYSKPTIVQRSAKRLKVLYYIGDKVEIDNDGQLKWDDEDNFFLRDKALRDCEKALQDDGYTIAW